MYFLFVPRKHVLFVPRGGLRDAKTMKGPESEAENPRPENLNPKASERGDTRKTLNPKPPFQNVNPRPQTLIAPFPHVNPRPQTLIPSFRESDVF